MVKLVVQTFLVSSFLDLEHKTQSEDKSLMAHSPKMGPLLNDHFLVCLCTICYIKPIACEVIHQQHG